LCAASRRIRPAWQIQACGPFFSRGMSHLYPQKYFDSTQKTANLISSNSMLSTSWFHEIHSYSHSKSRLTSITLDCIIAYCLLPFRQYQFVTSCVPHDSRYRHMGQFFLGSWAIFARKIFWQRPQKILIWPDQIACYQRAETDYIVGIRVSFKTVLPDSPHPIIVSIKNQTSGTSSRLME